jgi:DNA polymerase-4
MSTAIALRKCPSLVLVPVDYELYSGLSEKVFEVARDFSPICEAVSIDEAYLDMTGSSSLFGAPLEATAKLRQAILERTGLTISVGIASNRLVAKVATDQCKPDGVLIFIEPHHTASNICNPILNALFKWVLRPM